jgi:hypothetical protein
MLKLLLWARHPAAMPAVPTVNSIVFPARIEGHAEAGLLAVIR